MASSTLWWSTCWAPEVQLMIYSIQSCTHRDSRLVFLLSSYCIYRWNLVGTRYRSNDLMTHASNWVISCWPSLAFRTLLKSVIRPKDLSGNFFKVASFQEISTWFFQSKVYFVDVSEVNELLTLKTVSFIYFYLIVLTALTSFFYAGLQTTFSSCPRKTEFDKINLTTQQSQCVKCFN